MPSRVGRVSLAACVGTCMPTNPQLREQANVLHRTSKAMSPLWPMAVQVMLHIHSFGISSSWLSVFLLACCKNQQRPHGKDKVCKWSGIYKREIVILQKIVISNVGQWSESQHTVCCGAQSATGGFTQAAYVVLGYRVREKMRLQRQGEMLAHDPQQLKV